MQYKIKFVPIYSIALAKKLIKMGFVVKDIKPNKEDHTKTVFFFEECEEIVNMIK